MSRTLSEEAVDRLLASWGREARQLASPEMRGGDVLERTRWEGVAEGLGQACIELRAAMAGAAPPPASKPKATDGAKVTANQWDALDLVIARADGGSPTHLVATPVGDAAITNVSGNALERHGFITIHSKMAWPTEGGRRAQQHHIRTNRKD